MKKLLSLTVLLALLQLSALATIRRVPGQYTTIKQALQAATNGDTILVAPGTYFENLHFKGKRVVLTSQFLLSGNVHFIRNTIINGSQPPHPDTASVVRFTNGEDATTQLIGFTLTGGSGTKWPDAHISGKFREGGAILCEGSSPIIRNNIIAGNQAINTSGVVSAGGGAIRCDGGQPQILNNVITRNRGRYGAGIVLNYSGGIIRNNIISLNFGGEDFGGSGIWMLENGPFPKIIENNTIVGNRSVLAGGGIRIDQTTATVRNNIIWGNSAPVGAQMHTLGTASLNATYNFVEKGYAGNSNQLPLFADSCYFQRPGSPTIDGGDLAAIFNDPGVGTVAAFPSAGSLRNDAGVYGGPGRSLFPYFSSPGLVSQTSFQLVPQYTGSATIIYVPVKSVGAAPLKIDSVRMKSGQAFTVTNKTLTLFSLQSDSLAVTWQPNTVGLGQDTLLVYHNDPGQPRPLKVGFRGVARLGTTEAQNASKFWLRNSGANPVTDQATLTYEIPQAGKVSITLADILGRNVLELPQGHKPAGKQEIKLATGNLPAGVYLVRLTYSNDGLEKSATLKLVVKN